LIKQERSSNAKGRISYSCRADEILLKGHFECVSE
jgi:hypothetical protein